MGEKGSNIGAARGDGDALHEAGEKDGIPCQRDQGKASLWGSSHGVGKWQTGSAGRALSVKSVLQFVGEAPRTGNTQCAIGEQDKSWSVRGIEMLV